MRLLMFILLSAVTGFSQLPSIEPGVSQELAKWRAARYSDVRYKLDLTLEKMSPVLKGTIEIRVNVSEPGAVATGFLPPVILDWRKIKGHEDKSTVSNVSLNGAALSVSHLLTRGLVQPDATDAQARTLVRAIHAPPSYEERDEHLIFRDGVVAGENVIKLDFTSPILTSGSAITRYVDKEDGSEYIYSLFVPSDASTAFPVFDQPDLKARFSVTITNPAEWSAVTNTPDPGSGTGNLRPRKDDIISPLVGNREWYTTVAFPETKPISTYVFAFAAGPFEEFSDAGDTGGNLSGSEGAQRGAQSSSRTLPTGRVSASGADVASHIYVRRSQAAKFKPHAAEVFRLNREAVKYLETYFDYKFPWPKYDLVLIPEFPFGGMEHAGATFLREQSVIFPQEPTKNDIISRANLIFHEAAHQWFGDCVTMKWFDDLWLKEGFAEFMAYKTLEKVMPEVGAWKVFYERNKQAAYATDSTKGTTAIYQPIKNLSAAKSAYGNIVYRKAPSFLRQAEFYLGEDKFQTAVRSFLKKHEFANAGWEDLVNEFEAASRKDLKEWATAWVKNPGVPIFRAIRVGSASEQSYRLIPSATSGGAGVWEQKIHVDALDVGGLTGSGWIGELGKPRELLKTDRSTAFVFPNYQDYGYGIFLLDDKSRDYVLKNIGREKDAFLRSMMWGSLWDSVREGELDPKEYVELVIKNIALESDEGTIQTLLGRVTTAMNYYLPDDAARVSSPHISKGSTPRRNNVKLSTRTQPQNHVEPSLTVGLRTPTHGLRSRLEGFLIDKIENASTQGQRITYYRAFLNIAASDKARGILKQIWNAGTLAGKSPEAGKVPAFLKTKDKFDIVTRLAILGDADAAKMLADLEKTETSDDAKRYAYAARAAFATPENKAKFWNDFVNNKDISESWIEAAFVPFNSVRHSEITLPYLERALAELPTLKRSRKIFFVNSWLAAFIGGQRDEKALVIVNKFLAENPKLDNDLRLKILENLDVIERGVKIRSKY